MIDVIRRFFAAAYARILADSEEETEADGFLSWQGEWHAAWWGFAWGFIAAATGHWWLLVGAIGWVALSPSCGYPEWVSYPSQFKKEMGYLAAFAVLGIVFGVHIA